MNRQTIIILSLLSCCCSPALAVEVDDTDPSISYNGAWGEGPNSSPDFDQYEHYSNDTNTTATFSFTGTTATAVGKRGPNFGFAGFLVDGHLMASVDAYNPQQLYQQNLYTVQGIPNGCHTLTIQVEQTKNPSSSDYYQVVDAFITDGTTGCVVNQGSEINDTDQSIVYSLGGPANWNYGGGPEDYSNDEHYSNLVRLGGTIQGVGASVTFNGTGITWMGKRGPNFGMATYSIDGGAPSTFDGYSPAPLTQNPNVSVSGLASGSHVLQLSLLGSRNGNSSDYYQVIDGFQITGGSPLAHSSGTTVGYSQISTNSGGVSKSGSWTCGGNNPSDLSGGHCWSNVANSSIAWTFNGSLIEVFGRPDLEDGYLNVYVDSNPVAVIDASFGNVDDDAVNAYLLFAKKLSPGQHTITLSVAGVHRVGATDNYVQIDELTAFQ